MRVLVVLTSAIFFSCSQTALGQSVPPKSRHSERSHIERFSSPGARAERAETDATAKLAENPNDAEALNARALARMTLDRYAEAYEDLQRAVSIKADNATYQANLGYALWKMKRRTEAIEAERIAVRLDDKSYTAHYQLGRFLMFVSNGEPKQLAEAAVHLERALEIDPRRSEVRFDLLTVYRTLGDMARAIKQLKILEDSRPSDVRVVYADALLASDRGDLTTAITGFREALRRDPGLDGGWQDLGLAFIKLKRWPEAIEAFAELTRRRSDSVEGAYFHALALFNAGRVTEAESESRRALRLESGLAAAHTLLGIILASRGGADVEAGESLSQAVALDPTGFDAHFYLGRVQYMTRDYAAAAKSLRAAVNLSPRHAEARFFLGTALEAAGESNAALDEYQQLVQIEPQSAIGQVGLGALQVKQGKIDDAIATLKRAISLDGKIFEAHWALGRALALAERHVEAIEPLKKAVSLMPNRPDAHYQLGLALRRAGRHEEAKAEFAIVDRLNAEFRSRTQ